MSKYVTVIIFILMTLLYLHVNSQAPTLKRVRRFFFPWGGSSCGGPGSCPDHHCSKDPAVIHGYCCGCARMFDRVPIHCPFNLRCPPSSQPLCTEYDYMMDCCC